jgi:type I restriction enzyme S subunit
VSNIPPIDVTPEQWTIVRDILKEHVPDHEVRAFGSRATWTAKPYSDLDLTVITAEPLRTDVFAAVREAFTESDLPWRVDVVDWSLLAQPMRSEVARDWVVVQRDHPVVGPFSATSPSL